MVKVTFSFEGRLHVVASKALQNKPGSWPDLVRSFPWLFEVYIDGRVLKGMKALPAMEV
jgi:hypothetical protein